MTAEQMHIIGDNLEFWTDKYSQKVSRGYVLSKESWIYQTGSKIIPAEVSLVKVFGALINDKDKKTDELLEQILGLDLSNFTQFAHMARVGTPRSESFEDQLKWGVKEYKLRLVPSYGKQGVYFPTSNLISHMYQRKPNETESALHDLRQLMDSSRG